MFFALHVHVNLATPEGVWRAGIGAGHAQTELDFAQPVEVSLQVKSKESQGGCQQTRSHRYLPRGAF